MNKSRNKYPVIWAPREPEILLVGYLSTKAKETSESQKALKSRIIDILLEYSSLRQLRKYYMEGRFTFYNQTTQCFTIEKKGQSAIANHTLQEFVSFLMVPFEKSIRLNAHEIKHIADVVWSSIEDISSEFYKSDLSVIPFGDGNWSLSDGSFQKIPDYKTMVDYRLPFNFHTSTLCPKFDQFIKEMAEGHENRDFLLRAHMYACFTSMVQSQNWLHIYGKSNTGNTQFSNLMTMLMGQEKTLVTTLDTMNTDRFELQHLENIKLVICNRK